MDKLKQALFNETLYQRRQYQRCQRELGEWDTFTLFHKSNFKTLYDVIIEGECEDEYIAWVSEQEEEK